MTIAAGPSPVQPIAAWTPTTIKHWSACSQSPGSPGETAPPIPANATWPRVNGAHVAVWVYRGQARVDVADRSWELRTGEAMILPAGVLNTVTVPTGFTAATARLPLLERVDRICRRPRDRAVLPR